MVGSDLVLLSHVGSSCSSAPSCSCGYSLYDRDLMAIIAAGVGLNLTSASVVVIFDPDWNPCADLQAASASALRARSHKRIRLHRYKYKTDALTCFNLSLVTAKHFQKIKLNLSNYMHTSYTNNCWGLTCIITHPKSPLRAKAPVASGVPNLDHLYVHCEESTTRTRNSIVSNRKGSQRDPLIQFELQT